MLDAPCGAGRHSLGLARLGHHVTAVDFNPAVLAVAQQAAQAEGLGVDFCVKDLRDLNYEDEFDVVCNLWTSIGYFNDEDNESTLENLARAVKPGGYLLLDLLVSENLAARYSTQTWQWWGKGEDRVRVCEERRWDFATARVETTWTFLRPKGEEEVHRTSIRVYTCRELVGILARFGLAGFRCLDDTGGPFSVHSRRLWLEAQKPA